MSREPCQKGTSVLPVVAALKAHPSGRSLVPASLWKYFDEHMLVSGWYPERDYFALLEALVKTIDAKAVGGDVWRYFAKFSVQQDISGASARATGATASHGKGVYRNFGTSAVGAPEQLFRRAIKLWSQYHDTGTMQITGWRTTTERVVMQLVGFAIPMEGFVRLQGYYLEELGRVVGVAVESTVTRSTARGHRYCEWELDLAPTPASQAYIGTLSIVP
ncbi:MAG: hypothetical protein ACRENE_24005 [Polyangiaceae bacterium]